MLKEMQLIVFLVLCSYLHTSRSDSPQPEWRQSRFIIDNRRNFLFSQKSISPFFRHPTETSTQKKFPISDETFKRKLFTVDRYQKDLSAEASISEPNYYEKYNENSLPRKLIKPYEDLRYRGKNSPGPQSYLQAEENNVEGSGTVTSTEIVDWSRKTENVLPPQTSTSGERSEDMNGQGFGFDTPTSQPFPWTFEKTEEGNQIDKSSEYAEAKEKHVYETRIETVSYHQEVIFNPPKTEANTQKENWYRTQEPKENHPVHVEEPEQNYEQPEENYEEPEKNYEEPERNYEVDESVSIMSDGRAHKAEDENNNKFGYVVEGKNYRKYRVEERTPDGFIVGEYGVVSHDDGSLRGVRYTADGTTNPQLIYETLIKFLSL